MSSSQFLGKSVIVTGSSSGIGKAIAVLFAERGASVTLCGRDQARLDNVREECQKASGGHPERFIAVCGDLNEKSVRQKILADTIDAFGHLDILIPNAGISPSTRISTDSEEDFDLVINTNLKSVYFLIQIALPFLEKTKGNIVIVSSIASTMASPRDEIYQMSKAGLDALVHALALYLGPKGMRVNAINPGLVLTRIITRNREENPVQDKLIQAFASKIPLHKRCSTAEEQAEVVVFLASDQASFVTGLCLKIDGGVALGCFS